MFIILLIKNGAKVLSLKIKMVFLHHQIKTKQQEPTEVKVRRNFNIMIKNIDKEKLFGEIIDEFVSITERDYAERIAENILSDVAKDIEETAEINHYNSSDVRYAIGRVLVKLTDTMNN